MNWYTNIPFFTRTWLTSTVILTFLGTIGFINPYYLTLAFEPIVYKFQIWRPITGLFFYPIRPSTGLPFLINCCLLHRYSRRMETRIFTRYPEDYFIVLRLNWICCVVIGLLIQVPFLMDLMVFSVLQVWCELNNNATETIIFDCCRLKAKYLPWALMVWKGIIKGGGVLELLGIFVGHLSVDILRLKQIM